jgi:hypothetical protein
MDSNDNNSDNNIEINNNNKNEIEFQEYYENKGNEEKLMISDGKNITNYQEIKTDNLENEPNEELIDNKEEYLNNNMNEINDNDKDNDSLEREEMENEYELVKALNEYKEQNKKLKAMNNYQKTKIESLENELEKVNNKFKLNELELNDIKSKAGNKNINNKDNNSNAIFMNQIYNLNSQLDKYKNLVNEKKSEYKLLLDKYNDIQKKYNQLCINDKKRNQELVNKDKQIIKLLDDLDKKNVSIVSNTAQQMKDKEIEKLVQENKKLEKQKNDLYAAFKKCLKLCSILKKQKVHLENARLLSFTEEEFKNLMEENKI